MRTHLLAALLCSWLVLVDTLFLGVSRLHLNDMVQMLFIALTHWLAIHACKPPPRAFASRKQQQQQQQQQQRRRQQQQQATSVPQAEQLVGQTEDDDCL